MTVKPSTAGGYDHSAVQHVRATCLYVATKLGDLLEELVIVGGLVPSLLIDQADVSVEHVGTLDLDVGLALAIFDEDRYQALAERLREAKFAPSVNEQGNVVRQTWKIDGPPTVTIDFLIPPTKAEKKAGRTAHITGDFAAFVTKGLWFAFQDREEVILSGKTLFGEDAERKVWVCGPGAFVVLKALALHVRGANKDAYDLVYMLQNHNDGVERVAARIRPYLGHEDIVEALSQLDQDFSSVDAIGPRRAAEFLSGDQPDPDAQADAFGVVRDLLTVLAE